MAQTFDPTNVTILEKKDGTIPDNNATELTQEVINTSVVMQLGKMVPMEGLVKKFTKLTDGGGAYWVNETQKIPTAPAKLVELEMQAKKLGVIVPVSNEYLRYGLTDFFNKLKPFIVKKFNSKFDEAVVLGKNNPFKQSIARSVASAETNLSIDLDRDGVFTLENALYDKGRSLNGFISTAQNISALRKSSLSKTEQIDTGFFKRISAQQGELDGFPVINMQSSNFPKGTLIAGDFNELYYGVPMQMEYKLLDQAQLSTIVNEDGSPINLAEQDMTALRVIMHIGVLIARDDAFAAIKAPTDDNVFATMPGSDKANSSDPDAVKNTHKPRTPGK